MIQICKYDPKKDLACHRPGLSLDLSKSIETRTVQSTGVDVDFNEIHPDDVVGRVEDVFQAIDSQRESLIVGRVHTDSTLQFSSQSIQSNNSSTSPEG